MLSLVRTVTLLSGLWLCLLAPAVSAAPSPWQIIETPNFRVLHLHSRVGQEVARAAERWRTKLDGLWSGGLPAVRWKVRCDLYLFRDNAELVHMTGGGRKAGSALALQSRLMGGKVFRRRINLAANDRQLLSSTLPHEVAHVVLKDLVRDIPRWADEGIAMSTESRKSQRRRILALRRAVRHGPFYRAKTLMSTKRYPEREYIGLYYAQSYALARFFITRGGPRHFIAFLRRLRERGARRALRQSYGIGDFTTLQRLYLAFARGLVRSVAGGG